MVKEKMVELKIKVPQGWVDFVNECCSVLNYDFDKEMRGWIKAGIECNGSELKPKDYVRLLDKYNVSDIFGEVSQRLRDEAAGKGCTITFTSDETTGVSGSYDLDKERAATAKMLDDRITESLKRVLLEDDIQELIVHQVEKVIKNDPNCPLAVTLREQMAKA